jgi:hypothetical protein
VSDIAARRLRAQRLTSEPFASAVDAISWLGAVQAQDYGGAKWALSQRVTETTDAELDRLFDQGSILRTHVLRPTWHFVLPEDIRWMLELTAPRVRRGLVGRYRRLELDAAIVARSHATITAALEGGNHLTRAELGGVLRAAGLAPDGQRLPHLLMAAELDGVIASGPRRGKEFTYALLEERAPEARPLERSEAVVELARRYFLSHGPAQLQDFVWWSGLTTADARTGIAEAGGVLGHEVVADNEYWFDVAAGRAADPHGIAHLLPNFDEYTVAYRDRTAIDPEQLFDATLFSLGGILSNIVTVGGTVRGAGRRTRAGGGLRVEIRTLQQLDAAETAAVEAACRRLGRFLQHPVEVAWL